MAHWSGGGIKRDKTDALFSDLVRERADWKCERCRKDFRHNPGELHCSHIFGRRKKSVRVNPENALALCAYDHQDLGENPPEHTELVISIIGRARYDRLRLWANKPTKFTAYDKEIIHQHLLGERQRMLQLRKDGVRGRIEFTLP